MYARTMNLVRRYFAERDTALSRYLILPTEPEVPKLTGFGFVGFQIWLIVAIGTLYTAYGVFGAFARMSSDELHLAVPAGLFAAAGFLALFQWWSGSMIVERKRVADKALTRINAPGNATK